jgi:hypothetical protein
MWNDIAAFDIGLRIPGGVSWHITPKIELSVGLAPGLGILTRDGEVKFMFNLNPEIVARFWF